MRIVIYLDIRPYFVQVEYLLLSAIECTWHLWC